jgi:hypothetical protein
MSPELQDLAALGVVAAAAVWLVMRSFARGRKPGCGGDCGCPSGDLRAKVREKEKAAGTRG